MITAGQAAEAARRALELMRARGDALSEQWAAASLGEPLLVQTLERQPAFWLVPVVLGRRVLGAIEIAQDGSLRGQSLFCSTPERLGECPPTVTRISAEEAQALAAPLVARHHGALIGPPLYVVDSVGGRLAWMIEVRRGDELVSRVFATPGYAWERRPDEPLREPGIRG